MKQGRPPKSVDCKKSEKLQLRTSADERAFLDRVCECYSVDISSLVRTCCLNLPLPSPVPSVNFDAKLSLTLIRKHLDLLVGKDDSNELLFQSKPLIERLLVLLFETQKIPLPTVDKPRNQPRLTIRFTQNERAQIRSQGKFIDIVWQEFKKREWQNCPPINAQHFHQLREIQRNLNPLCSSGMSISLETVLIELTTLLTEIVKERGFTP